MEDFDISYTFIPDKLFYRGVYEIKKKKTKNLPFEYTYILELEYICIFTFYRAAPAMTKEFSD